MLKKRKMTIKSGRNISQQFRNNVESICHDYECIDSGSIVPTCTIESGIKQVVLIDCPNHIVL